MKKTLRVLTCVMPLLLLGAFYICRLGFDMRDGNMAGMLTLMTGAVLSALTPTVHILAAPFGKPRFRNRIFIIHSFLSGILYWLVCYFDFGRHLHQFIAA